MRRDVFQAIADPNRRAILQLIVRKSLNLNAVADQFSISRPAVSKHMKILTECGLVSIHQEGRERYCRATLQPLAEVHEWMEQYRIFWNIKLDTLELFLSGKKNISKKNPSGKKSKRK
jgi:DNA-binding transcriptional ArsR family regulator